MFYLFILEKIHLKDVWISVDLIIHEDILWIYLMYVFSNDIFNSLTWWVSLAGLRFGNWNILKYQLISIYIGTVILSLDADWNLLSCEFQRPISQDCHFDIGLLEHTSYYISLISNAKIPISYKKVSLGKD